MPLPNCRVFTGPKSLYRENLWRLLSYISKYSTDCVISQGLWHQIQVYVKWNRNKQSEILRHLLCARGISQIRRFPLRKSLSFSWKCLQSTLILKSSFVVSECFSILRETLILPLFWGRFYMSNKTTSGSPSYFSLLIWVSLQSIG